VAPTKFGVVCSTHRFSVGRIAVFVIDIIVFTSCNSCSGVGFLSNTQIAPTTIFTFTVDEDWNESGFDR
jgi:hypothetical protein